MMMVTAATTMVVVAAMIVFLLWEAVFIEVMAVLLFVLLRSQARCAIDRIVNQGRLTINQILSFIDALANLCRKLLSIRAPIITFRLAVRSKPMIQNRVPLC